MGIHKIPVIVYIRGAQTRAEAVEEVKARINFHSTAKFGWTPLSVEYPNDEPDGEAHLVWAPGYPPEQVDDGVWYDPNTGEIGDPNG